MSRALGISTAAVMFALLAVVAAGAAAKPGKSSALGGTLNVDLATDVNSTDPALDYVSTGWEIEYATCLKLMNYPDANGARVASSSPRLLRATRGSVRAARCTTSGSTPVHEVLERPACKGANFKAAIDRDADPKMESPAVSFLSDIVGAGKSPVSGAKVKGSHLIITLTKAAPDFVARLAMPFFCAVPTNLAHDPEASHAADRRVRTTSRTVEGKSITIRGTRTTRASARTTSTRSTTSWATPSRRRSCDAAGRDRLAAGGIPPASYAALAQKYGINKGRFWISPRSASPTSRSTMTARSSRARTEPRSRRRSTTRSTARR